MSAMNSYIIIGIVSIVLILARRFFGAIVGLYRIFPFNKAHVKIILNKKKNVGNIKRSRPAGQNNI